MNTDEMYGVRFTTYNAKGQAKYNEKFFRTDDARAKWITKQEESGRDIEFTAYCDPRLVLVEGGQA